MKKLILAFVFILTILFGANVYADVDTSQDFFSQDDVTYQGYGMNWIFTIPANSGSFVFDINFTNDTSAKTLNGVDQWATDGTGEDFWLYIDGYAGYEGSIADIAYQVQGLDIYDIAYLSSNHAQITLPASTSDRTLNIFMSYYSAPFDEQDFVTYNLAEEIFSLYAVDPGDVVEPEFSYSNLQVNTPYYDLVTAAEIQAQLHATDDEDGDVSNRIEIYEDHYTSVTPKEVGGVYYIMYRVSDTAGNYAYLRVDVNVFDDRKPYFIDLNDQSILDGANFSYTWYNMDPEGSWDAEDYLGTLVAYDEYYGFMYDDPDPWFVENVNDFSQSGEADWHQTPGVYHETVTYTEASGNTASYSVTYTVLENNYPVISGANAITVEVTNVNIANILSNYSATDTEDGTLSVIVDGSNSWNYASPSTGTFTLTVSSTDSLGAKTTKSITVNVVDTTAPVIKVGGIASTTYTHTVYQSDTSTLAVLISTITATDTYDGTLTSSLVIPASPSFTTPGSYTMNITVEDSSGNESGLVLTVVVADDIDPTINGPIKVVKGKTATMPLSDVTAQLSAIDNVDGTLTVSVYQDGYTGHASEVGSYLVRYKAIDTAGNITYHDVRIWVVDNVAPVWVIDDYFINLGLNETMTRTQLIALLQASGMLANDVSYTVTFLTDDYTGNEEIAGAYSVTLRVTYDDGSEDEFSVVLSVPEDASGDDIIVVNPDDPTTGLQRTLDWIASAAVNVWNFIKSVGTSIWSGLEWTYDHILLPVWNFLFVKDVTTVPDTIVTTTSTGAEEQAITTSTTISTTTLPVTTTSSPLNEL